MKIFIVAATLLLTTNLIYAGPISSITITGGDFNNGVANPVGSCGTGGPIGTWQCFNDGTDITITSGTTSQTFGNMLNYMTLPMSAFLDTNAVGAEDAHDWSNGFQGMTDGSGNISLNLGGFYINWNGVNYLQGTNSSGTIGCTVNCGTSSIEATGTYTGNIFDIRWNSFVTDAPFAGSTFYWHITGTFTEETSTVPIPATFWLFGSGLIGLIGMARRRV